MVVSQDGGVLSVGTSGTNGPPKPNGSLQRHFRTPPLHRDFRDTWAPKPYRVFGRQFRAPNPTGLYEDILGLPLSRP